MKKISRKKLTTFNIFICKYIEASRLPMRYGRYSAKQNLIWLCDRVKEINKAVRPQGGKVSDDQVVALAKYMIDNPPPNFSMPRRMLESLEESLSEQSCRRSTDTKHSENSNPKIARRNKKKNRSSKIKEKEDFYKSWDWKRARYEILKEYGPRCMLCKSERGDIGSDGEPVRICVDHIKPISKFWDLRLERSNLQILCSECNMGKGAWDQTNWRPDGPKEIQDDGIPDIIKQQLRYSI